MTQRIQCDMDQVFGVCYEILEIMETYNEQEQSLKGIGTPGGLEHMGDVWSLFMKWEKILIGK